MDHPKKRARTDEPEQHIIDTDSTTESTDDEKAEETFRDETRLYLTEKGENHLRDEIRAWIAINGTHLFNLETARAISKKSFNPPRPSRWMWILLWFEGNWLWLLWEL